MSQPLQRARVRRSRSCALPSSLPIVRAPVGSPSSPATCAAPCWSLSPPSTSASSRSSGVPRRSAGGRHHHPPGRRERLPGRREGAGPPGNRCGPGRARVRHLRRRGRGVRPRPDRRVRVPVVVTLHTLLSDLAAAGGHPVRVVPAGGTGDGLHRDRPPDGGRTGLGDGGPGPGRSPRRSRRSQCGGGRLDRAAGRCPTASLTEAANELGLDRLASRTVLSTFGLISASKGLELMIRALPPVVAARPDVLYLIAGQTHPEVVSTRARLSAGSGAAGPRPRPRRARRVRRSLPVGRRARRPARRTDLYVTPYRSPEQIVSGALTFAVAAGCRLSPPYRYAENLLGSGAGVLVPFGDVPRLSAAVLDLLDTPASWTRPGRGSEGRADLPWASVGSVTLRSWPRPSTTSEPSTAGPWSRPACRRSGPATCCGWSTTSASSSTPAARCRPARPATASTTWHGWPSWPFSWGGGADSDRRLRPSCVLLLGLPDPRLGAGDARPAQLHGLRTALAGRAAPRRPCGPGDLGPGRGGRGPPTPAGVPDLSAPADRDGTRTGPPDRARELAFALLA